MKKVNAVKLIEQAVKRALTEAPIKTYYVKYSSEFDRKKYDYDAITSAVKSAGGKNVVVKNLVSNQPDVVVFKSDEFSIDKIKDALNDIGIQYPIISNVLRGRNSNY